ncbi:MAG: hypothetical protein KDA24_09290 [Deltaproteobacteria bacterium]|nr:hypothetical protein [Deltaproteobacteria bacterium]
MSDEQNPFAPPQADLQKPSEGAMSTGERSLDDAMAGNWSITPSEIIKQGWEAKDGVKLTFLIAFFLIGLASGVSGGLNAVLGGDDAGFLKGLALSIGSGLVVLPLTAPLQAGLWRMMIRRAAGQTPEVSDLFAHFKNIVPICIGALIVLVATYVGFALLVLPGIYLSIAASLTTPLIAERGLEPLEAFQTSIKALNNHFFDVFVLYLLLGVVGIAGFLAFGIGLIWAAPAAAIASGYFYLTVFGWEDKVTDSLRQRLDPTSGPS